MKNLKFFLPFAALGLLASCSNDNVVDPTPDPTPEVEGNGMYMTINVAVPNASGTKASLDKFDDGDDTEYAVNSMKLYIFKTDGTTSGTPEADAAFVKSLSIGFQDETSATLPSDVKTQKKATFQVDNTTFDLDAANKPKAGKYYGLLVVNQPTNESVWKEPTPGQKFEDWNKSIFTAANVTDPSTSIMMPQLEGTTTYFTMTNAPYVNGTSVVVLEEINTEKFTTSPTPASQAAATFYVQRGVAKVALEQTNLAKIPAEHSFKGEGTMSYDKTDDFADFVKINQWALDVTNKVTFPVQNVTAYSSWSGAHFTANPSAGAGAITHIWWGIDPNYTGAEEDYTADKGGFNTTLTYNQNNKAAYCLENTMNFDQMIKNQTTRVVLEATYLVGGNELSTATDSKESGMIVFNDIAFNVKEADLLQTTTPESDNANNYKLSNLIKAEKRAEYRQKLMMGDDSQVVTYYPGNKTYYVAYIRHFDNSEAGLTGNPDLYNFEIGNYQAAQLGRYGVLRNNSYEVKIVAVSGFGSPTPPPPGNTPDDKIDNKKYNALVNINILKWANRKFDYTPQ